MRDDDIDVALTLLSLREVRWVCMMCLCSRFCLVLECV